MSKIIKPIEIDEDADVCSVLHLLADDVDWGEVLFLAVEGAYEGGMNFGSIYSIVADALQSHTDQGQLKEPRGYA